MDDFLVKDVVGAACRFCLIGVLIMFLVGLFGVREGVGYTDYEISDCRYFMTYSRGLYSRNSSERLDVFYNDTKYTISVSRIKISDISFVRVYDDCFSTVEVYLTQDDYMFYLDSKGLVE